MTLRTFVLVCILLTVIGCKTVQEAQTDYQVCMADPICVAEVERARALTFNTTKAAASSIPFPNVPESIALITSNVVAFAVGVIKGRKKRG